MIDPIKIYYGFKTLIKRKFGLTTKLENLVADNREVECINCPTRTITFGIEYCDASKGGCGCSLPAKRHCMDCECPFNKWFSVKM